VNEVVLLPRQLTREMWAAAGDAVVELQARGVGNHDKITEAVFEALVRTAPKPDAVAVHNDAVGRLVADMWTLARRKRAALNVLTESLLCGVGMLNYPSDPRRQALIIQEIADAAQDRAKAVR
jgi:hypothetical protein